MSRGLLFVMSGPSGTGKGTICNELLKREDIFLSISSTTREKRKGEEEGVTYNYISSEEFTNLIENDEMLEYAVYGGNYYGTPRRTVEKMLNDGINVLLEIEVQGALKVKSKFEDANLIFVVPPSMKELKNRLIGRGRENEDQIMVRMDHAKWEMTQSGKYNYIVVNDDLERCTDEVCQIFRDKKNKSELVEKLLNEKY